ncbi:MAG: hypothetical protein ING75_14730 [Rhodocyclaceae bacterium]|nr:hypothetical protein [Rhodocyclaceae bacterium]
MAAPLHLKRWRVVAGNFAREYYTDYHATQMATALRRNGMVVSVSEI